jgi:L-fucose isomerase-like protein
MELLKEISTTNGIVSHLFEKVILPPKPNYVAKIALVGIGLEEHFDWQSILKNYGHAKQSLSIILPNDRFELISSDKPLQSKEEIYAWLQSMHAEAIDGIIIYQASFIAGDLAATLARWLNQNKIPVLSWSHDEETGGRLSNNRLCGQNFLLNIFNSCGVKYSWLFESPDDDEFSDNILKFAKSVYVIASMNQKSIGMVGGFRVPGFYDCELNELSLLNRFGIKIDRIDFDTIWQHGQKFTEAVIQEIKSELLNHSLCKFNNVSDEQISKSIRLSLAMADYAREKDYLGIGLKNWPELFDHYGIAGDGAGALVQDLGIPVADESDMGALLTMIVMNQISFTNAIPTLVDLSLINKVDNQVGFWHCGGAPTKLIDPATGYEVRNHSILENFDVDSSMGMLLEFLHKQGPVTIAKYQYPDAGRVLTWEGNIRPSEMAFRGSYAEVEPRNNTSGDILSTILNKGLDHHWIIGRGFLEKDLNELNHWLGISNIEIEISKDHLYGHSN